MLDYEEALSSVLNLEDPSIALPTSHYQKKNWHPISISSNQNIFLVKKKITNAFHG